MVMSPCDVHMFVFVYKALYFSRYKNLQMKGSCLYILKDFPIKGALDLISPAPEKKKKWNQRAESTGR